jgi:succinoglycan biosynthesis protein ExoM
MQLAICIGTFLRPQQLGALLAGLGRLTFRKMPAPDITVIVVDNDSSRTAEQICQVAELPWPIKYVVETRRGITHVRNRAIGETGQVDFIAFIDDDEVPEPGWLDELLYAQAQFDVGVVSGRVLPRFTSNVAEWVREGGYFDKSTFVTGDRMERCSTNNVLIKMDVFEHVPGFDDRFNLCGAEDTHFFLRVRQAGHTIVWSQEATVYETISTDRANLAWILRRSYQNGNSWVFCEASLDQRWQVRAVRFFKALGHVVKGSLTALVYSCAGRRKVVNSLRKVFDGLGMIMGLVGRKYLAYQSPVADPAQKIRMSERKILSEL